MDTTKIQHHQLIEHSMSMIFSSNPANGANNVRKNGSEYDVILDNPISLPLNCVAPTLEVLDASVWYVQPNIAASIGNNVFYYIVGGVPGNFTIADGLYSLSALNALISVEMVAAGHNADQIVLSGDNSTQKSVFTFPYINTQVSFVANDSPFDLIGFTQRLVPLAPSTAGQIESGDSQANFNSLNSYLIHSTMVDWGIPVNNIGQNIVAKVPILASPGFQVNYEPTNPVRMPIDRMKGMKLTSFVNNITDQDNNELNMLNEFFDFTVLFRWYE
jgi:hypothetical protein